MKHKKVMAFLMALAMTFALTACGGGEETPPPEDGDTGDVQVNEPAANQLSQDALDWWTGDWYGWWTIFDGTGAFELYTNEAWDCCAYIEELPDGTYLLSLWDEDYNDYQNDCLAEVVIQFDPSASAGDKGAAISTDAAENFFWSGHVGEGDWVIDPEAAGTDNMLVIESTFTQESDGSTCEYGVVLTKWGHEWNEDAVLPPDYYETYFVPLMESGEALPEVFTPES